MFLVAFLSEGGIPRPVQTTVFPLRGSSYSIPYKIPCALIVQVFKIRKTVRNTLIATMSIERRGKTVFKLTREKKKKKKKNDSFERDRRSEDAFEDGRTSIKRLPTSRKVFDEYSLQKDSRRELWTSIGA